MEIVDNHLLQLLNDNITLVDFRIKTPKGVGVDFIMAFPKNYIKMILNKFYIYD